MRLGRRSCQRLGGGAAGVTAALAASRNGAKTMLVEKFTVQIDGQTCELAPGAVVRLKPGQSICLHPYIIHSFCGEEGTGIEMNGVKYTVSGEVSSVCDDWNDNCFLAPMQRFPVIEEDEPRRYYLCNEYSAGALLIP